MASAVIGVILLAVAVFLAIENYSLLMGERAPADVERQIPHIVTADDAVRAVVSPHTLHLGPNAILVAVGAEFQPELDAMEIETAVGRLHRAIGDHLKDSTSDRLILIEPASRAPATGQAAASLA